MRLCHVRLFVAVSALFLALVAPAAWTPVAGAEVPAPESFFGFRMGDDGRLASWPQIRRYFESVAAASDRVELVDVGPTTDGDRIIGAIVSAPENIRRLDAIRAASLRLADPRSLSPEEAQRLIADQKVVVAIGCGIHAVEIGATQAANELLYTLATGTDERTLAILRDVVVILLPSLNPDGHTLVVDWFEKTKGTKYDSSPMPWPYHKYAGHDINRDAFMQNMVENRNIARLFYREWHPQIFLTMHQMGSQGPRFFVPPTYEPVDPNYDPIIWREIALLGNAMALELERDDRPGVVQNALFDYYWPGYEDSAPLGHNIVCVLTEAASARLAAPVTVAPGELTGSIRGLPEYRLQTNFPNPWPGGLWRPRDIVEYNLIAARGLLDAAARYREEFVANLYLMGRRAVEKGRTGRPFAFLIPPDQYDPYATAKLTNVLLDGSIEVHRAQEPFRADGVVYPAGTDVILMAQPFRAYAKTLLERQDYPARRSSPAGPPERPYDVAGWTLPYQMGVNVVRVERYFEVPPMARVDRAATEPAQVWGESKPSFYVISGRGNGAVLAVNRLKAAGMRPSWLVSPFEVLGYRYGPGSIVVPATKGAGPIVAVIAVELGLRATGVKGKLPRDLLPAGGARVALYKPWVENTDEGWTRWLLEQYEFPYATITDDVIRHGDLQASYDVIIVPDSEPGRLIAGHRPGTVPPEYAGGLGADGVLALRVFVEAGGTLICLDSSADFAIDAFKLPVKNVVRGVEPDRFFCPGSILALDLDTAQPLAYGLPQRTAAFFAGSSAYEVLQSASRAEGHGGAEPAMRVSVAGRYAPTDLLMSGWLEGGDLIAGRPAIVEVSLARGRVVLIGFRAQHRAQSHATFRLLFNAILTSN